jgi:predicted kinase
VPRVILLKGLPASGKSTWAKEQVRRNPGRYKRVNKDELREMLDAGEFSEDNEKFVIKVRDRLILAGLESGKDVIVDDTNLNPAHEERIRRLVKGRAEVEVRAFEVEVEEAIRRDRERARSVGEKVIREMHDRWLGTVMEQPPADPEIPPAIICDMDGTLALLGERSPYDASTADRDLPNEPIIRVLLASVAYEGARVFLISGREEKYRKVTERWLQTHGIAYDGLFLRRNKDFRKDTVIKRQIYEREIHGKYRVLFVLEDRDQVVAFWRSLGLTCLQVAEGDF